MTYFDATAAGRRMTVREASAWFSLVSTLAVYVPYFIYIHSIFSSWIYRGGHMMRDVLGSFVLAVVVQAGITAAARVLLATQRRPEMEDERDAAIELRAYRNAYRVLALLVVVSLLWLSSEAVDEAQYHGGHILHFPLLTHWMLGCFVIGQCVKFGTRALYYHRGAGGWQPRLR